MRTADADLELLSLLGLRDVTGNGIQIEHSIAYGRDRLEVKVGAEDGGLIRNAEAYTLRTFGVVEGHPRKLKFTSSDARDIFALLIHLSYSAAYRNTSPDVRREQIGFEFNGDRVVMPFYKEDEFVPIGYRQGQTTVLEHPASYYGDLYLKWRQEVVEWAQEFYAACKPERRTADGPSM